MSYNTITLELTKNLLQTNSSLPLSKRKYGCVVNLINLINVKMRMVYQKKYSSCQLQKRTSPGTKSFKYNAQKQLWPSSYLVKDRE